MTSKKFPINDFQTLVQPLIGLPITRPWQGHGSTIFLELGDLSPTEGGNLRGQACIWLDWDWRFKDEDSILFGSSMSGPWIQKGLSSLVGKTIKSLSLQGRVNDLIVDLNDGGRFSSMPMVPGPPRWNLWLFDRQFLCSKNDELLFGDGHDAPDEFSDSERRAFDLAEQAAKRWNVPSAPPDAPNCRDCKFFVRLDGAGHMLDFGCCISSESSFDGRVVKSRSGCEFFSDDDN